MDARPPDDVMHRVSFNDTSLEHLWRLGQCPRPRIGPMNWLSWVCWPITPPSSKGIKIGTKKMLGSCWCWFPTSSTRDTHSILESTSRLLGVSSPMKRNIHLKLGWNRKKFQTHQTHNMSWPTQLTHPCRTGFPAHLLRVLVILWN